jgi:hypothetical protein
MDDFAASNKFTDDDPLPAVEGGEKTALQAFDDMCDLYKARIRELEATLRAYICNECGGEYGNDDPDCTDATCQGTRAANKETLT